MACCDMLPEAAVIYSSSGPKSDPGQFFTRFIARKTSFCDIKMEDFFLSFRYELCEKLVKQISRGNLSLQFMFRWVF